MKLFVAFGVFASLCFPVLAEIERSDFKTLAELRAEGYEPVPVNGPDQLVIGMALDGGDVYSCWSADTETYRQERVQVLTDFIENDRNTSRDVPNIELVCVKLQ